MQHDNDDIFSDGIDGIFDYESQTDREEVPLTIEDDDFKPIGYGRKSQYAIRKKRPDNRIWSVEVDPEEPVFPTPRKRPSVPQSRNSVTERSFDLDEDAEETEAFFEDEEDGADGKLTDRVKTSFIEKRERVSASVGSMLAGLRRTDSSRKESGESVSEMKPAETKTRKPAKNRSFKEEFLSFGYLAAMVVGGAFKKLFGRKRNIAIAAAVVGLFVVVWGISYAITLYRSNTAFADEGKNIDENAIIVRKVTDTQNRDKVTYFLIAGVDKSSKLTDCVWVMCLDNEAHKIDVLQIPRDTYVGDDSIPPHKMNAVYESPKSVNWCEKCGREVLDDEIKESSGTHLSCGTIVTTKEESGINALIRCINTRLSLPVDHYVLFDFAGFEQVIDAMGGVDITVEGEKRIYPNKKDYVTLHDGLNHLDGKTALIFMRNRKTFANGDLGRVQAQRQLIHSMMQKVEEMSVVTSFKVLMAAKDHFKTDMSVDEITSFLAPVKKCKTDSLHMFELPGKAKTVRRTSYYICDEEKTAHILNEYMLPYSDKLTADDIDFPDPE